MFDIPKYLRGRLSKPEDSGDGSELVANCPVCDVRKFYVNRKTGRYVCFDKGCTFRGRSMARLVMALENVTWAEALEYMGARDIPERRDSLIELMATADRILGRQKAPQMIYAPLPDEYETLQQSGEWYSPIYMECRGFRADIIEKWKVGYCRTGRYADRIVIPFSCPNGSSFQARSTVSHYIKYLGPQKVAHSQLLIGWSTVDWPVSMVVVAEGPLDAMALQQHGLSGIGLGGRVMHKSQYELFCRLPRETKMIVMLDPEETADLERVAQKLCSHFEHVRIAELPMGEDPGSALFEQINLAILKSRRVYGSHLPLLRIRADQGRNQS